MKSLDDLQLVITEWGLSTFEDSTPESLAAHLYDEVVELSVAKTPADRADEGADLFILLVQHAARSGYDLAEAVSRKHAVNQRRTWATPDRRGVVRHVEEGGS